ncbi:hypothetical protein H7J77_17095 [Mycolicibacillus parakoreensis]|uniref:Uncharacterized protein n=1 Tax=Mycolicibacillus parakoreensis TaxID=1069221 RepID=A0ABY3U0T0_9MYCO|nr:hypothetical protein [Mycolicibacillus parakoreensis]MCV7317253.1 hypothetical protein [Mycolicibacillus parakoreensis]ULN51535.1 hypothetical protein MIU77_11515 [Mycolicibacillus parakoreensis]
MTTKLSPYAAREQRAAEIGWTPAQPDFITCPRHLVGKRCRNDYGYALCWCSSRLNDHGAMWLDNDANRNEQFVLWEPYGADGDELAAIIAAARADGIRVHIDTSVWAPEGRGTVGIRFSAALR